MIVHAYDTLHVHSRRWIEGKMMLVGGEKVHMLGARFQSMSDNMESLAMPGQGMSRTY